MVVPDWVLDARARERLDALGMRSAHDYAQLIESPGGRAELEQLIEVLRVGETRFFRHQAHVQVLIDTVIPTLRERRSSGPVRVWSAGCASGEEAYTLAMVLHHQLSAARYQISVLATDVSARAIATGQRGQYPASAIAKLPPEWQRRAFQASDDAQDQVRIAPAIARLVQFERRNLLDGRFPTDIDILWCRNVFIYFTPEARVRVASRMATSLAEHGVLFIGYSESLRDVSAFTAVRTPNAVIYQRASQTRTQPVPRAESAPIDTGAHRRRRPRTTQRPTGNTSGNAITEPVDTRPRARAIASDTETTAPVRAPAVTTIRLTGTYDHGDRMSAELSQLMSGAHKYLIIDLDRVEFMSDQVAPLLRRAISAARAAGTSLTIQTGKPSVVRYLRRHNLPFTEREAP